MTTGKTIALTRQTFVGKVMSVLWNMLSRLVITFLPRSKRLLISWLQSPFAVILEHQLSKRLMLNRFSRVRLCDPIDGSPQGSPFLGFSRQEHWSGLPFLSPVNESESEVTQLYPTPSDPMDRSLPGSSVHGTFQARVLSGLPLPSPIKKIGGI